VATVPYATYRRRRIVAGVALVALLAAAAAGARAMTAGSDAAPAGQAGQDASARAAQAPPPQLPRGGRAIFPAYRVVAFYGAPQAAQLGELGIGTPRQAGRKLLAQAKPYARRTRPVLPAMELIAVVAAGSAGPGGRYNLRQPDSVIRRYLRAARRVKALLLLDIQPGRSDFFTETTRLRKWLKEPDVGLALDPEWRMGPSEVPGQVIGHVSAREVNATTAWLSQLVARDDLPEKLVVVHQFTDDMVPEAELKRHPGLAYVLNADGFGSDEVKVAKYRRFVRQAPAFRRGFKLFYHEDVKTMSPAKVMGLRPRPDVVVYE
jgi:hypothetical protein